MAVRYDYALDNNELVFKDGDLLVSESDTQHIVDTMNAFAGWWKEFPLDGVGMMSYMKSPVDVQQLNRKILVELESDGYKIKAPVVKLSTSGGLFVNPNVIEV
jgi:uncharacterized protein YgfB (UPF0149 family)